MSTSRRLSNASAPFRLEWRPSRWLVAAHAALGVAGALSVMASDVPSSVAWWLAPAALSWGAWLAVAESRRAPRQLLWSADGTLCVDGLAVADPQMQWRGPLAVLRWRDAKGYRKALVWWPDTLDPAQRRELRLAAARAVTAALSPSMAP